MGRGMVGLLIVSGVAMLATSSLAIGALKTKRATTAVPSAGEASATAKCKRGSEVAAIGFSALPFDLDFDDAGNFLIAAQREGKRKATGSGANFGDQPGDFTAFAYCQKPKPKLKRKASAITLEPDEVGSATAKCPKGSVAVSGGSAVSAFDRLAGPEIYTFSSHRDGKRKWTVAGHNFQEGGLAGELTAFAHCDESNRRLKQKAATTSVDANYAELATATAKCKKGSSAVSGGFESPDYGPSETLDSQVYPLESKRAGKRKWTVAGVNNNFTAVAGDLVAYAYCEKKD